MGGEKKRKINNYEITQSIQIGDKEVLFEVDEKEVEKTDWFDEEITSTKHVDFFSKRSVNYTKRNRSITMDDLF